MKKKKVVKRSKILKNFKKLSPEDFDGHTEFSKLTIEERLKWLSDVAEFRYLVRNNSKKNKKD